MRRRQLPLAFTCPRSFDTLAPAAEGRDRWCEGCRRTVHDLSARSESEARALLRRARDRQPCVAYEMDARGRVRARRMSLDRVGVALATAALLATTGCMGFLGPDIESEAPDPVLGPTPRVSIPDAEPPPAPTNPTPDPFVLLEPDDIDLMSGWSRRLAMGRVAPFGPEFEPIGRMIELDDQVP